MPRNSTKRQWTGASGSRTGTQRSTRPGSSTPLAPWYLSSLREYPFHAINKRVVARPSHRSSCFCVVWIMMIYAFSVNRPSLGSRRMCGCWSLRLRKREGPRPHCTTLSGPTRCSLGHSSATLQARLRAWATSERSAQGSGLLANAHAFFFRALRYSFMQSS